MSRIVSETVTVSIKVRTDLQLVDQDLALAVDLHDQTADGLLDLVGHQLAVLVHLLQPGSRTIY